ncbi:MAG: hypothetical protein IPO08_19740 [Xanthomonadales bacterium]|nr:hypothetical protein [Xanthomonadales bacterium]
MDALIADSADMIDAPASADALGEVERVMAAMRTADGSCYARGTYRDSRRYWEGVATAALPTMSPAGEVGKIVAWLRGDNGFDTEEGLEIADAIERGDYRHD